MTSSRLLRLSYLLLHHTADRELGTPSLQGQTFMRSARQKHAMREKLMCFLRLI